MLLGRNAIQAGSTVRLHVGKLSGSPQNGVNFRCLNKKGLDTA